MAYASLASVLSIGVLLASLVWFLDAQLNISTTAYCFFYDTWNTQANELNNGWLPAIAGAAYGAMIGAITMSIAASYMIIRTTIHQPEKNHDRIRAITLCWRVYAIAAQVVKTGRELFVKLKEKHRTLLEHVLVALKAFEPSPI
ncbi:MAG: hypothetical protein L3J94_10780 [Gammaproteobacteria bacterium]|nr:hypothetical protein [Gammaproteobacteria bacterium]